jgi:hypothetical protein
VNATEDLLRRLAANDEPSLRALFRPTAPANLAGAERPSVLDRQTRTLVQLAALLASDAATTSVRWAVDRVSATGADDAALVRVLLVAGSLAGSAQMVASAWRLALAIDIDLDLESWDAA